MSQSFATEGPRSATPAFAGNAGPASPPTPAEWALVLGLLGLVFALQFAATWHLTALAAFDQYNLFFDADSNQYISAVAHGWSFNRAIHPGFALLFNVPARAIDLVASMAGLLQPGAVRAMLPLLVPATSGLVAGLFWWLACCQAGLSPLARTGGLLLMQGSFSQVLFASVPECYPVSGAFYGVLLWAAARAHRHPQRLEAWQVQGAWIVLAVVMTGVTVTNGAVCVAVWLALRLRAARWRRWLAEGLIGSVVVGGSILGIGALDRWAYSLEPVAAGSTLRKVSNHGLASNFVPASVSLRALELPAHALASIVSPPALMIRNELAEQNANRYQFGFSFIESAVSLPRLMTGWALMLLGVVVALPRLASSALARACAALFAFNAALHAVWGSEVFLYSQHWLAFLVFAIAAALHRAGATGERMLCAAGVAVAAHSAWRFGGMIATLETWR